MVPILLLLPDTPHGEYITAIEQACLKLEPHNAEELRVTMRGALRNSAKNLQVTSPSKKPRHAGRAQERPIKSHSHCGQRGSHSHYGQGRLPRKSKGTTRRPGELTKP